MPFSAACSPAIVASEEPVRAVISIASCFWPFLSSWSTRAKILLSDAWSTLKLMFRSLCLSRSRLRSRLSIAPWIARTFPDWSPGVIASNATATPLIATSAAGRPRAGTGTGCRRY
jgi:hypothetical protein